MHLAQHPSEFESSDLTQPKHTKTPEALIINISTSRDKLMTDIKAKEIMKTLENHGTMPIQISNYEVIDMRTPEQQLASLKKEVENNNFNAQEEADKVINGHYIEARAA